MPIQTQHFDNRQIMNHKHFEILHYKTTISEPVSIHHHDFYEIFFFLGSNVSYWVDGKTYQLESGDLLLISPMELHQPLVQPGTAYQRVILWIERSYLNKLSQQHIDLTPCFQSDSKNYTNLLRPSIISRRRLYDILDMINREMYSGNYGSAQYSECLLVQLLIEINRLAKRENAAVHLQEPSNWVAQITTYINNYYHEDLTLERLAKEFFVSKYYLSHEFSRQTGISIYKYIVLKRLTAAREMIASGHMPGEVFKYCGFHNYTNFYRAFKAEYGTSPRVFAEQFK